MRSQVGKGREKSTATGKTYCCRRMCYHVQALGFYNRCRLQEMDGLDNLDPKKEIFTQLGVFNNVEFVKVPEFYRFQNNRIDVTVPANSDEAIKLLVEQFPDEAKGIRKFFKRIHKIQREICRMPIKQWFCTEANTGRIIQDENQHTIKKPLPGIGMDLSWRRFFGCDFGWLVLCKALVKSWYLK